MARIMTDILPPSGHIENGIHHFPVRIFYQDTDVSGIVYHANYLNFCERARTEFLRVIGITQRAMMEADDKAYFAVRDMQIDFLKPAFLDDALLIRTHMSALNAASVTMQQQICRGAELLCTVNLRVAVLGNDGRPRRWPAPWRKILQDLSIDAD
jgi:acyl-CoA thioester hydrolase